MALSLRKQREKSGLTIREVSERLGVKSLNAYAQYEKGKLGFRWINMKSYFMQQIPFTIVN